MTRDDALSIIKDSLTTNRVTQAKLARLTGVSRQHIGHILRGIRNASPKVAHRICSVLGLGVEIEAAIIPEKQVPTSADEIRNFWDTLSSLANLKEVIGAEEITITVRF